MRVCLINPPRVQGFPVVREERFEHRDIGSVYPPLSLLYCAAVVRREGHEAFVLDANGKDLDMQTVAAFLQQHQPKLCVVRLGFDTQAEDLAIVKLAADMGCFTAVRLKIVGDTPWLLEEFMQKYSFVNVFFMDEPEFLTASLLKVLENDGDLDQVPGIWWNTPQGLRKNAGAGRLPDPDELPFPAYDLLGGLDAYHTGVMDAPFTVVQSSRGCPFTCSFCSFGKLPYRKRKIEKVVEELSWLKRDYGLKSFLFFDDVLTLDAARTRDLMEKMIAAELNMEWVCCTRANTVDRDMLSLMKQAGCREIAFGIESGSDEVLEKTTKGVTKNDIRQAARWCHEVGILFYGLVIIGLPGENEESVQDTIDFINEIEPFYTQFCFSVPFPNSETWHWYREKGFLSTDDYRLYFPLNDRPVIRTEALSQDDLVRLRRKMYLKTMLRPRKILRAIRLDRLSWTLRAGFRFLARVIKVATGSAVR